MAAERVREGLQRGVIGCAGLLALSFVCAPAWAACPESRTTADLASALELAEAAYARLDVEGFRVATDAAGAVLPCLADPLPSSLAARHHRFDGLRAFVDRAPEPSARAFAAARSVEPDYRFPEALVPTGHPVLRTYSAVDLAAGTFELAPLPAAGHLAFDGRVSFERATAWPTILQRFDGDGAVAETVLLAHDAPLPVYPTRPPIEPRPLARAALFGGMGGLGLSAGMLGAATASHAAWARPDTAFEELGGLRRQTNGLTAASVATGILSGAAVALAVAL